MLEERGPQENAGREETAKAPLERTEIPTTDSTGVNDNLRATASDKPKLRSDGASVGTTSLKKGAAARAEAIARIKAENRMRNSRPLSVLAGRENARPEHSAGLAKLSDFDESRPWPNRHRLITCPARWFLPRKSKGRLIQ
jgi:hypothetical protein